MTTYRVVGWEYGNTAGHPAEFYCCEITGILQTTEDIHKEPTKKYPYCVMETEHYEFAKTTLEYLKDSFNDYNWFILVDIPKDELK